MYLSQKTILRSLRGNTSHPPPPYSRLFQQHCTEELVYVYMDLFHKEGFTTSPLAASLEKGTLTIIASHIASPITIFPNMIIISSKPKPKPVYFPLSFFQQKTDRLHLEWGAERQITFSRSVPVTNSHSMQQYIKLLRINKSVEKGKWQF